MASAGDDLQAEIRVARPLQCFPESVHSLNWIDLHVHYFEHGQHRECGLPENFDGIPEGLVVGIVRLPLLLRGDSRLVSVSRCRRDARQGSEDRSVVHGLSVRRVCPRPVEPGEQMPSLIGLIFKGLQHRLLETR